MAANPSIDPGVCLTAPDAFKNTLPQVRQFHRSLTTELDEKNARLRSLVGGSYRQLLGTAETILQMREDIAHVEDNLGNVGAGCGRVWMSNMANGILKVQKSNWNKQHTDDIAWSVRVKALGICAMVVKSSLRPKGTTACSGKNLVISAKVLVLSRLLLKSLGHSRASQAGINDRAIDQTRRKIDILRRRLLRTLEKSLSRLPMGSDRQDLLQILSAYSLASSSGAKDVLTYFLKVREDAIVVALGFRGSREKLVSETLYALELYFQTLLDVQVIVPRRLAETLAGIKATALLSDETLKELETLRLNVCQQWFGDEIKFFTPYARHDDLDSKQAMDMFKTWTTETQVIISRELGRILGQTLDIGMVVELRTKLLKTCIKNGEKVRGLDSSILVNDLRSTINASLIHLLDSQAMKLGIVSDEIEATLCSWEAGVDDGYEAPWDQIAFDTDINGGGILIKQIVLDRANGRNSTIARVFEIYQAWKIQVEDFIGVLEQFTKQRWDDDLEGMGDDVDLETLCNALCVEDPTMLRDHLTASLAAAYTDLNSKITSLAKSYQNSSQIGQMSTYILRAIREISQETSRSTAMPIFVFPSTELFHEKIASMVSKTPVAVFLASSIQRRVLGRMLWEGSPEQPVQPSPRMYKLLHDLVSAVARSGGDLWSPNAVTCLKRRVRAKTGQGWDLVTIAIGEESSTKATGRTRLGASEEGGSQAMDRSIGKAEDADTEMFMQALFDIFMLQNALELPESNGTDVLDELQAKVEGRLELDLQLKKRLRTAANEYWNRTALLFSPL